MPTLPDNFSEEPAILRNTSLLLFLLSRGATALSYQMLSVAVGWQVYAITGSALYLGLVGLAQFLPMFLLTLVVGHVADNYNRRWVICLCQSVQGAGALVLAAGSCAGWLNTESILLIMFVIGGTRSFESPTMQAYVPDLVPASFIPRAVSLFASSNQTAAIIGPAFGGLLYVASPSWVYFATGALFLAASLLVFLTRSRPTAPQCHEAASQSLFAGIHFIRGNPTILGAISLDLFAVLLGGATALLPIYAQEILGVGPQGLGLLRSAPAAGALSMSLFLARFSLRRRVGLLMFAAVIIFGMVTILFAVSTSFLLSLGALVILGAANVISVVIRWSLVQMETPNYMRGRVSAVNSLFTGTSNQLGDFESGLTAAWFGAVPAVLIGGVGTVLVAVVWMRLFPSLLRVDTLEQ
ncbi:MAG TPA: MFS transporter [Selenomonadales bacterium]|nr:MFS transporter [Selenomonadales bacterium]